MPQEESKSAKTQSLILLVGALLLLAGALALGIHNSPQKQAQNAAPAKNPDKPSPAIEAPLFRRERSLMGTIWSVQIAGVSDERAAAEAADRALDEVDRLENLLSEWRPETEISRVNQAAGKHAVHVGRELMDCVNASIAVAKWSDGAFDISWAALRGVWDFSAASNHTPPTHEAVQKLLPLWNYRNIEIDEAASTIFLKREGMQIGLGGVAKGYALDRAGEILQHAGFANFMIFGGGQILAHGSRGARAWRIGVQHPRKQSYFAFVEVNNASVSTSGDYEHWYEHDGVRYHHIIDPHTGFPSNASASVTLIAPTALWADAVDTAVFILGPKRANELLPSAPGGPFEAVIVDPAMRVSTTPGTEQRLFMHATLSTDHIIGDDLPRGTDEHFAGTLSP